MDEGNKRSLRNRKRNNYNILQTQDPELQGYFRPNYAKEFVSPAQELNLAAKLLARFINSSNKHIQQKSGIREQSEKMEKIKEKFTQEKVFKKSQIMQQLSSKKQNTKIEGRDYGGKNTRNQDGFKHQNAPQSVPRSSTRPSDIFNKDKFSTRVANEFENNKSFLSSQYAALMSQYKNTQQINFNNFALPHTLEAATHAMQQQQRLLHSSDLFKDKIPLQYQIKQSQQSNEKIFGRSAYHVAIAYHIHLQHLSQKGIEDRNCLDPTHAAKQFRDHQEKHTMVQEEQVN